MVTPSIKKRVAKVAIEKLPKPRSKRTVTTSLEEENYKELKRVCAEQDWSIGAVLDALIEGFLEEVQKET